VTIRLTPKGGRDAVEGVEVLADGRPVLKVRVRAAPIEGEANAALIKVLAKALGLAPRQFAIAAGATARVKRDSTAGAPAALAATLARITGDA
jgi:uncharacterized protein YggU (UPF0235/DUF167 family)